MPVTDVDHTRTARLDLDAPTVADLDELHEIFADPRVWQHLPSGRHLTLDETRDMLDRWLADWAKGGLGTWVVRADGVPTILGTAGCSLRADGAWWNLGYRFAPAAQGHGYAREAARAAIDAARTLKPHVPVVALLLGHNEASRRVAEDLGLELRHRGSEGPDTVNGAVRLVMSDRPLPGDLVRRIVDADR